MISRPGTGCSTPPRSSRRGIPCSRSRRSTCAPGWPAPPATSTPPTGSTSGRPPHGASRTARARRCSSRGATCSSTAPTGRAWSRARRTPSPSRCGCATRSRSPWPSVTSASRGSSRGGRRRRWSCSPRPCRWSGGTPRSSSARPPGRSATPPSPSAPGSRRAGRSSSRATRSSRAAGSRRRATPATAPGPRPGTAATSTSRDRPRRGRRAGPPQRDPAGAPRGAALTRRGARRVR